ncbi:MAG TPA: CYTH domain-containing protein [Candidatus Saccharibacteria bacterium]|nr:CYTH domain-containing protein [Candidatus Saccharibacteria bacterium]HRK94051.1 CYTH domain-containing protein [Candidatus Saccharibacteria bacterium]
MKTEIEVKFLDIDIDEVRDKLKAAGAHLEQPMRLMKRALVETEETRKRNGYLRVRDEGDKITATFKQFKENSLTGAQEREITVSDFDETLAIFAEFGLNYHTFQESKRETWKFEDVEVVIDEWPWINPYIEIEADSEDAVKNAAKELGYDWDDAVFGSVDVIYNIEYPNMTVRGVIDIKEVRFGEPAPKEFVGKAVS